MRCASRASNGPNHLGLCALQGTVKASLEQALTRILTPKQSLDIVADIHQVTPIAGAGQCWHTAHPTMRWSAGMAGPTPLHRQRPHLEAAAPSPAPSAMCSRAAAVAPSGYPAGKAAVRDLLLRSERCREVDDAGKVSCTREPSNPSNRPTLAASRASCRASCQASCSVWRLLRSPRRNSPRRRFPPCNAHTVQEERQCLRQNVLAVSLHDPDAAAAAAGCATG